MEKETLLFIMPFNNYTLIYYKDDTIKILKVSVKKYLKENQYKVNGKIDKYKQSIISNNTILFPTHGKRNEKCCWINATIIFDYHLQDFYKIINRYGIDISLEKIIINSIKALKGQEFNS